MPDIIDILSTVARIDQQDEFIRQNDERIELARQQAAEATRQFDLAQERAKKQDVLATKAFDAEISQANDNKQLNILQMLQSGAATTTPKKSFEIGGSLGGLSPDINTTISTPEDPTQYVTLEDGTSLAAVPNEERFNKIKQSVRAENPDATEEVVNTLAQRIFLQSNTSPTSRAPASQPNPLTMLKSTLTQSLFQEAMEAGKDVTNPEVLADISRQVVAAFATPNQSPTFTPFQQQNNTLQSTLGEVVTLMQGEGLADFSPQSIINYLSRPEINMRFQASGKGDVVNQLRADLVKRIKPEPPGGILGKYLPDPPNQTPIPKNQIPGSSSNGSSVSATDPTVELFENKFKQ